MRIPLKFVAAVLDLLGHIAAAPFRARRRRRRRPARRIDFARARAVLREARTASRMWNL